MIEKFKPFEGYISPENKELIIALENRNKINEIINFLAEKHYIIQIGNQFGCQVCKMGSNDINYILSKPCIPEEPGTLPMKEPTTYKPPVKQPEELDVEAVEDIFAWLLGEKGEFPMKPENGGNYWWRTELRRKINRAVNK